MRRTIVVSLLAFLGCVPLAAQFLEGGTSDYALANSSVSWLPKVSSLFVNPAELARLHQNDFQASTRWFNALSSMSADVFVPSAGTVGIGTMPQGTSTMISAGYGRLVGNYSTVGSSMSVLTNVRGGFRFSVGGAVHLPTGTEESGLHAGVSASNLPTRTIVDAGIGYWIVPTTLRIQFATQTRTARAGFIGAELNAGGGFRIQGGVRNYHYVSAGVSYESPYAVAELGAGAQGFSFTFNIRFGTASSDIHQEAVDGANEAYGDERYSEAGQLFERAVQFDEYDDLSRHMVLRTRQVLDSSTTALLLRADSAEKNDDYPSAMQA
ncbi:MAG TPA: hypothetical protein VMM37_09015, partial [Bacteroidota bacterium]|nr:hypothetical protein [Bacteroidota bacterium]